MLSQRAEEAAAFARAAVTDAQDFTNAHASILAKHRTMFLERAFGIDPDGRTVIELKKEFKSVKTYEKYNDMIRVISNWGDNALLKEASVDDPVANSFRKFRKSNPSGYNYVSDRIQVDLIDMRAMRKKDVYGNMQRWIMTIKDHSTGLVYLCALPRKKAIYVAAELEKYFGLIGFPEIFHTGMFTFSFMLRQ
jgi:hypothetical protein